MCYLPPKKTRGLGLPLAKEMRLLEEREKKCWVTTVRSGNRELGDVPVDCVLCGLVEATWHGSDGAF